MRTENLSIVFVDIAGFTPKTSAQSREENERMLKRFSDMVRPLVRAYRGKVVKTIGDAYMLTFSSPTDAVLCSTAIHDRLAEENATIPEDDRFNIRAAVNVGEVRVEGSDVFGEAVNIAARIEGCAEAGEVYFSEAVYLAMTRSEVPAEEVGYFDLKGIKDKVRLYRVPFAGDEGSYALTSRESKPSDASEDEHPLVPTKLPFAGIGLGPVRSKLQRPSTDPGEIVSHLVVSSQGWMSRIAPHLQSARAALIEAFHRWKIEVRRSRPWQIGTAIVLVLIIATLTWGFWPEKKRELTLWEKIQGGF